MNILIFFVILLVLVIVHEFGHFFVAKRFGIRVDEFGFGFPPKLFGIKKGETEYTFNALPIGGFVKIFGENPNEENTNGPDAARSFVNKARYKQALVLFAGVFANFLLAWLLFSFSLMSGLPSSAGSEPEGSVLKDVHLVVLSVMPDSPAEKGGLRSGDKIISLKSGGDTLTDPNPDTIKSFIVSHGFKELEVNYLGTDDKAMIANIIPSKGSDEKPAIGINMDEIGRAKFSFFRSFYEGMRLNLIITKETAKGLYTLIIEAVKGNGSLDSVTGPVGLVKVVGDAYQFGFAYLLSFAGLISANLAIINLFPFPALDGGRLLFLLIEKIKGSRMNVRAVNMANTIGFALLIFLMLLVTYHDVVRLF
ncbi:MAG TPA: site-2 protease family protein [Candidatus Paceibacterota bacterium]